MARVKLIQAREDISPEHNALFDELAALRGRISGPSSVTLHSPGLAKPWNQISEFLHRDSILEPGHAELAVCVTAREFDSPYIWAAHVPAAIRADIPASALDAISFGQDPDSLEVHDATLVRFARRLMSNRRVEDADFRPLLAAHGPRWMLELTAWLGRYAALACILNAFEVKPAPDAPALPAANRPPPSTAARSPLTEPRIPLLTSRESIADADSALFDEIAEGRGSVRGPFALLLHSPALCRAVLDVSVYLRRDNLVPAVTRELAVVVTARERDCPYVWAAHAPAARKEGVSPSVIEIVRDRLSTASISPEERDVIDLVRQLLGSHSIKQALFDRLLATYALPGLVDLVAIIGHYVFVTTILNACEVSPAPGSEVLPLH